MTDALSQTLHAMYKAGCLNLADIVEGKFHHHYILCIWTNCQIFSRSLLLLKTILIMYKLSSLNSGVLPFCSLEINLIKHSQELHNFFYTSHASLLHVYLLYCYILGAGTTAVLFFLVLCQSIVLDLLLLVWFRILEAIPV